MSDKVHAASTPGIPIPIVFLAPQLTVGGTEGQVAQLLLGLDRNLFRPALWCPGEWGRCGDSLAGARIPVCRLPLSLRRPLSLVRAVRWLRRLAPEIFHSFSDGPDGLDCLAAGLAGVPVFISSRRNIRHWDARGKVRWRERLRNRRTAGVIANCTAAAELCARLEGLGPERIHVVRNGVRLAPERSARPSPLRLAMGIAATDFLIGNVANLKKIKGQSILLRAFRQVAAALPSARLVICGEGQERGALQELSEELGVARHVFFLGLRDDLGEVYRTLDLYVHSSLAEGLPNAVLDAMAHGVPVVATTAGGTGELLAGHAGDCLVPPGDPAALAGIMLRMLNDETLRTQRGHAGRQAVAAQFTVSRMVAGHESLYLALAGQAARERARASLARGSGGRHQHA